MRKHSLLLGIERTVQPHECRISRMYCIQKESILSTRWYWLYICHKCRSLGQTAYVAFPSSLKSRLVSSLAFKRSKQTIPTGREQVPGTLGIRLMTREHLLRYAGDRGRGRGICTESLAIPTMDSCFCSAPVSCTCNMTCCGKKC